MLEGTLHVYFIGFFPLNSLVYRLVKSDEDNEFSLPRLKCHILSSSGVPCEEDQGIRRWAAVRHESA